MMMMIMLMILKALIGNLTECPTKIGESCVEGDNGLPPPPSEKEVDECAKGAEKFENMTLECGGKETVTESCTCWASAELRTEFETVTNCVNNPLSNGMKCKLEDPIIFSWEPAL